ncbi:bacillithiol system redox-active protein YtxJ [Aquimarina intermedia]|uniref:Bacillithiol system protein YtxJ n=1 Tax=Aquimarina intermedia TaxID=350814 RepID=A0A5S5BZ74_9FLAO|nr:bacillithiol system redox-active protein YtxJ [Aquimarina intermedia]TYP72239.1 bacillithiol system protein YtxJ [Aquimarina intermedia]
MGFFNKFLGSDSGETNNKDTDKKDVPWIPLTDHETLKTIKVDSNTRLQAIFKHSTRCGISRMVLKNFEGSYSSDFNTADIYFLDLLNHRDLSAKIASEFDVMHESPQLILLKNGTVVHHASHSEIETDVLAKYL